MPWAPTRPCPEPGCPNLTRGGRCPACARQHEQQRRPAWVTAFYSSVAWQKLRALKRAMNPLCQDCDEAGRITPTRQIDHVIPITERPDLRLVLENLRALCDSCHAVKTQGGSKS